MIQANKKRDDNWSLLLEAVGKHKDQQAFKELFDHFGPLIKGFCLTQSSQGLPGEAAEELVQEVMFKVWTNSASFDPSKAAASTWIFTMMRNSRIDMLRKHSRHYNDAQELIAEDLWDETTDHHPVVQLEQVRKKQHVETALEDLPNEQKQALTQVYMQGKSHNEIAEESGIPLGTIKSRVRMGLKKMQQGLSKRDYR